MIGIVSTAGPASGAPACPAATRAKDCHIQATQRVLDRRAASWPRWSSGSSRWPDSWVTMLALVTTSGLCTSGGRTSYSPSPPRSSWTGTWHRIFARARRREAAALPAVPAAGGRHQRALPPGRLTHPVPAHESPGCEYYGFPDGGEFRPGGSLLVVRLSPSALGSGWVAWEAQAR